MTSRDLALQYCTRSFYSSTVEGCDNLRTSPDTENVDFDNYLRGQRLKGDCRTTTSGQAGGLLARTASRSPIQAAAYPSLLDPNDVIKATNMQLVVRHDPHEHDVATSQATQQGATQRCRITPISIVGGGEEGKLYFLIDEKLEESNVQNNAQFNNATFEKKLQVNWGSSTQAQAYNFALKSALDLNRVQEHVKNYRPQLLVLSGLPSSRPPLIDFAHLITKGNSLLMCGHVMKGTHSQRVYEAISQKAYRWFDQHRIKAFISIADEASGSFETAAQSLMQIAGLGKLRPNTVLMGYKSDWQTCPREELDQYFSLIHSALDNYLAVAILRMPYGLDYSSVLQDKDVEMVSSLDKKDAEDKIRRNQSEENPGLTTETSPDGDTEGDGDGDGEGSADGDVEAPADLSPVEPEASEQVSGKVKLWAELYMNVEGDPLSPAVMKELTHFRRKQEKGFVDVWWLYDDGGLTLLIPHILSTRSQFADCKLRIFSLANRKNQLDRDQRNLAALLSKFRIDYSDLIVIPDITKKAREQTKKEFEKLIENFRPHDENIPEEEEKNYVMESELLVLAEKTNRHMRLRELLMEYSRESTFVVIFWEWIYPPHPLLTQDMSPYLILRGNQTSVLTTLPMPRKGTVSAPLYLAWLELLTRDMPPYLILRGNQTSVLTYYS
ncbi:hypothetical protein J6590_025694 [Homalodisca vitripennis]|nr:hypothetical protein J6590_025694 [Homalodisca vitripennis]